MFKKIFIGSLYAVLAALTVVTAFIIFMLFRGILVLLWEYATVYHTQPHDLSPMVGEGKKVATMESLAILTCTYVAWGIQSLFRDSAPAKPKKKLAPEPVVSTENAQEPLPRTHPYKDVPWNLYLLFGRD